MCYAIPGQVMAIDGRYLTIRYFEETRRVINELPGMTVGEFVLAQGGHVISRVKPDEALATLETWRDLFQVLQERDAGMAVLDAPPATPDALQKILDDALAGVTPDRATMRRLLALDDPAELGRLYKTANAIRNRHHRNSCCVHGILEISSHCRSFCEYCGLAADVPQPHRYRMNREEILAARARGVIFDIGHGGGSFGFGTTQKMLAAGFLPDVISSDVHVISIEGPAFDLLTTMSKFLCLGVDLPTVIKLSTCNAAAAIKRPDLGTLKVGSVGEATVIDVATGKFDYADSIGERLIGEKRLLSAGVVLAGRWWHPA